MSIVSRAQLYHNSIASEVNPPGLSYSTMSAATGECGVAALTAFGFSPDRIGRLDACLTPMGLIGATTQLNTEREGRTVEEGQNEAHYGVDGETLGVIYPRNPQS